MARNSGLVSIQLDIQARVPKGHRLTRALLDQVVNIWADTGTAPSGFKIRIKDWKHGGKRVRSAAGFSQKEARERFRGLLQSGVYNFRLRGGRVL
jgi:hypothetical protein